MITQAIHSIDGIPLNSDVKLKQKHHNLLILNGSFWAREKQGEGAIV